MMRETYKEIPGDMCDFHSYYRRIAESLPNNSRIIEVGCADGHSGIFMAETMANLNKKFELVMVENMDYGKEEQQNTLLVNIIKSGLASNIRLISKDSLNASCKFPDNWAQFIFIDASHKYEETKADIRLWHRKVQHGFYLAGHDMNEEEGKGVWDAVKEVYPQADIIETEKKLGVWQIKKQDICL